jgi:hypothetical protein
MKTKLEPVVTLIALFVIALAGALESERAEASNFKPYLHIGGQVNASDATMGGGGFVYKGKLDVNVTFIAEGDTEWGKHDSMRVFSITRIVTPGWFGDTLYLGVGYANVQDTLLVGEHNFNLAVGGRWKWGRIYYNHISDFDIGTNNNTGLDGLHAAFDLSF